MAVRKSYPEAHNKILFEIEKQTQNKHATERKLLLDAFERLETGTQINTKPIINIVANNSIKVKPLLDNFFILYHLP